MKEHKFKYRGYTYVMREDGTWYGPIPSWYATIKGKWIEWKWRRSQKNAQV